MPHFPSEIEYSDKYSDESYEYRHVLLPKHIFKKMQRSKLLSESEWRGLGVQQSRGWVNESLFIIWFLIAI
jgi:cyclin-dependent kinase regulatory subunit CKS1